MVSLLLPTCSRAWTLGLGAPAFVLSAVRPRHSLSSTACVGPAPPLESASLALGGRAGQSPRQRGVRVNARACALGAEPSFSSTRALESEPRLAEGDRARQPQSQGGAEDDKRGSEHDRWRRARGERGGGQQRTRLSARAQGIRGSAIVEVSRLAQQRHAVNLAEGFPDFPAPEAVKQSACRAIEQDMNQYSCNADLVRAIARKFQESQGVDVDPDSQVIVCVGQSGALAAALLAVLDDGDEVLLLDPAFEAYDGVIRMAGGVPVHASLMEPSWRLDMTSLEQAVSYKTKALLLNSPSNPTGKVFSLEELTALSSFCVRHDILAITDEVYEHFVYDPSLPHISLMSLLGMQERTIVTSSISKSYSVTGWRIGWAIAPPALAPAIAAMTLKMVDSPPAPFQAAAVQALSLPEQYYRTLVQEFLERRDFVVAMLESAGLEVPFVPAGGYFVFARLHSEVPLGDLEFCKRTIDQAGVAFVPGRVFFDGRMTSPLFDHVRYVRVAFCKKMQTLRLAQRALKQLEMKTS